MKFFRNKEIKITLLIFILLTSVLSVPAFISDIIHGFFVAAVCIIFTSVYLISTYRRYNKLNELAYKIDDILHGSEYGFSINEYSEGELAILENEIQKMTARLREQNQNLQNDKIYLADSIADISHQIRTPLTSINLLIQLLKDTKISEKRTAEIIRELQTLLSRIEWLITTLLKMSRLDAGTVCFKTEKIPLCEFIKKSAEPLLIPIELRGQQLIISAEGDFNGDSDWTAEAIINIVKNCIEHTPSGGTIKITASENALYSEILIEDNGSGIDPNDLPHIFERFYKGKNSDSGSFGIGLALARVIVSGQNGTLKAENKISGGTLFTMRFYKGTV